MSRGLLEAPRPTLLQGLELTHIRPPGHAREGRPWESRELATEGRPLWQPAVAARGKENKEHPLGEPRTQPKGPTAQNRIICSAPQAAQNRFPSSQESSKKQALWAAQHQRSPHQEVETGLFPP